MQGLNARLVSPMLLEIKCNGTLCCESYIEIPLLCMPTVGSYAIVRRFCPFPNYTDTKPLSGNQFRTVSNLKRIGDKQFQMCLKWMEVYQYDKKKNNEGKGEIAY